MAFYYLGTQPRPDGVFEVHRDNCIYMPPSEQRLYLGDFESCAPAIAAAKASNPKVDGCAYCSSECRNG